MTLYSAIAPLVEATQWFRNGDHPDDRSINRINEGRVVKRHETYKTSDTTDCVSCGKPLALHGRCANELVCPGDYIITHFNPGGRKTGYSVLPKVEFESRYELYTGSTPK